MQCWRHLRVAELPWSGAHTGPSSWEVTSRALLKLRNLSLDIRGGSWRFWSWLRGLEELKMSSRWLKTSIRTSSEERQLGNELWECVFSVGRFCRRRRGLFLAMIQGLISSLLQRFIRHYLCGWAVGVTIQMTHLQFKRKCVLLKLSFVCNISKVCNSIISMNISFS